MSKRIITLCYRKIIRPNAALPWDKMLHDDSFMEFKMQAQNYSIGTPHTSYAALIHHIPNAQRLAAMVTPAISVYVQQLDNVMPDILNILGRRFIRFNSFRFEIINSDINNQQKHTVAINFFSEPMLWHDTVDNYLLVSPYREGAEVVDGSEVMTDLFQLQPYLTINSIKR